MPKRGLISRVHTLEDRYFAEFTIKNSGGNSGGNICPLSNGSGKKQ